MEATSAADELLLECGTTQSDGLSGAKQGNWWVHQDRDMILVGAVGARYVGSTV
jgi:hypothetical protein